MQLIDYQSITPPRKRFAKCAICALICMLTACQPRHSICGVTCHGTPFLLMQELTYNPNATTFPTDYLVAFSDTTFIYCIDHDGTPRTITCVTDATTHHANLFIKLLPHFHTSTQKKVSNLNTFSFEV